MFGEGAQVGFVRDHHLAIAPELGREHRSKGNISPAEVGSKMDESVAASGDTHHAGPDAGQDVIVGELIEQGPGKSGDIVDRLLRRGSPTGSGDANLLVGQAAETDRGDGERIHRELDGENNSSLGSGADHGRGAARPRGGHAGAFVDKTEGNELAD
jgi:hypothetical protein